MELSDGQIKQLAYLGYDELKRFIREDPEVTISPNVTEEERERLLAFRDRIRKENNIK